MFVFQRAFTVAIFQFIFQFILIILLPGSQKWSENEAENKLKMAQKWLQWTTLFLRVELAFDERDLKDFVLNVVEAPLCFAIM